MQPVIIDTDPGIDDTAAIFFALNSRELRVDALTTVFGNVEVEHTTRNALTLLEVAKRTDIPVYPGAPRPLVREANFAAHIHGTRGLGDVETPEPGIVAQDIRASEAIIEAAMRSPGEIDLIALGPLTNVALALVMEPRLANALRRVILMGGAVLTWGNATPAASANLYNDPEAARVVYRSNVPIVQVGLDVCRQTPISADHLARIEAGDTEMGRFLLSVTPFIKQAYESLRLGETARGVFFNDVPCIAYAVKPDLFVTRSLHVEIETQGFFTAGATVADFAGTWGGEPNAEVCLEVDGPGVADLFAERLTSQGS